MYIYILEASHNKNLQKVGNKNHRHIGITLDSVHSNGQHVAFQRHRLAETAPRHEAGASADRRPRFLNASFPAVTSQCHWPAASSLSSLGFHSIMCPPSQALISLPLMKPAESPAALCLSCGVSTGWNDTLLAGQTGKTTLCKHQRSPTLQESPPGGRDWEAV